MLVIRPKRILKRARLRLTRRLQPAEPLDPSRTAQPIVVAALGGSGTRAITDLLIESGVFMGGWVDDESRDSLFMRAFLHAHFDRLVDDPEAIDDRTLGELHRTLRAHRIGIPHVGAAWGWKNPRSLWLLPLFDRLFPGLRFIHLVRDGRDMALSRNRFLLDDHGPAILGERASGSTVRDQLELWALGNRRAAEVCERGLADRCLVLRYEDLCAEPLRELERLLGFLRLDLPRGSVERIAGTVKPSPGLGRGARDRSETMRAATRRHTDTLERFGYAIPR
ncbi:MAG: sulfotransferase [Myxococcota bacterium]